MPPKAYSVDHGRHRLDRSRRKNGSSGKAHREQKAQARQLKPGQNAAACHFRPYGDISIYPNKINKIRHPCSIIKI
jgi:hypothetical protein